MPFVLTAQVWVGSESNTGKRLHQNGTNVCLTTSGLPSFIHQADLLNFRTEWCAAAADARLPCMMLRVCSPLCLSPPDPPMNLLQLQARHHRLVHRRAGPGVGCRLCHGRAVLAEPAAQHAPEEQARRRVHRRGRLHVSLQNNLCATLCPNLEILAHQRGITVFDTIPSPPQPGV